MSRFEPAPGELGRLIDAAPLAWIVPQAEPQAAILMPVVRERASERLLGHLPRRHRAAQALGAGGRAQLLFLGPHGFVSNDVAGVDDWAPTWNFAAASLEADIALDAALTDRALAATVAHLEPTWTAARMGPRYAALAAQVIGFSATIVTAHPRFKLGQDERPEVRARIIAAFAGTPLGEWMESAAPRDGSG